jgi:hypothetical protein
MYSALRAQLRRARATVALLVLLTLALGEPLLCIIHCQIWLPIAYHGYFAAQHAHMHHSTAHAAMPAEANNISGAAFVSSPLPASAPSCFMLRAAGNHEGAPFHVPPSPVHDVLLALVVLIMPVLLASTRPAAPPGDPPRIAHPPRLRPPIPFAA